MLCEVSHYYFSCGTPRGACEQSGLSETIEFRRTWSLDVVEERLSGASRRSRSRATRPRAARGSLRARGAAVALHLYCGSRARTSHLHMDMHDGCSMHVLDHANMNWASVDTCADNDATRSCVAQGRAGLACASSGSRRYVFAAAFRAASRGI